AQHVGIVGMEIYTPRCAVRHADLEAHWKISPGKYTIGLGQNAMGVCDDNEDIHSLALTVVQNLLERYGIHPMQIGRLEVGTETIIDKAKSVKSVLMQLFAPYGNHDIEGIDTTNACYGGTNALLNCFNWMESSAWDGRYAIVVAADIAVYAEGPARPTGGAGAAAILIGPDAPLVLEPVRATFMDHTYDFYKPNLASEYPVVDGALTQTCYLRAFEAVYARYLDKLAAVDPAAVTTLRDTSRFCFHSPYTKLVSKAFGRTLWVDAMRQRDGRPVPRVPSGQSEHAALNLEKALVSLSAAAYKQTVAPGTLLGRECGNMYCASVYATLASWLMMTSDDLATWTARPRCLMYSYGSGMAATLFSLRFRGADRGLDAVETAEHAKLETRIMLEPATYDTIMRRREVAHAAVSFIPESTPDRLFSGTFYLTGIDDKQRRAYARVAGV
ncbi:hypothetical protein CXG81DRAFT_3289, partial [Caulochytrium protostelioides]